RRHRDARHPALHRARGRASLLPRRRTAAAGATRGGRHAGLPLHEAGTRAAGDERVAREPVGAGRAGARGAGARGRCRLAAGRGAQRPRPARRAAGPAPNGRDGRLARSPLRLSHQDELMTLSPRLVKGGLVQMDPASGRVLRVIGLQYNPDTLSRTLQVQAVDQGGNPSQALRLKGAAVETIRVEAEIDATERLDDPDANPVTVKLGIHPDLAALEELVQPRADDLQTNDALASAGVLEV